jgi:predicted dienelactone hydrolase
MLRCPNRAGDFREKHFDIRPHLVGESAALRRLRPMRFVLIAVFSFLAAPVIAAPLQQTLFTDSGLTYSEWLPKNFAHHRHDVPLIMFSHGFGGCAQQSRSLTRALAHAGYAVLAPNHKDKGCERYTTGLAGGMWKMMTGRGPDKPFGHDRDWNAETEASRAHDMESLLGFALDHEPYKSAIDPARIGLMGHSLGGHTVLGLAGAWPNWRDARFKAVLALAPFSTPFLDQGTLGGIRIAVMYMGGTQDMLIKPDLVAQSYAATTAPKYLVMLKGGGHFAFTELSKSYQTTIAAYAISFFDRTLLDKPVPKLDQAASGQTARYEHHL